MRTASVLCFDRDHPRCSVDLTGHNRHLLAVQFAAIETRFLSLDIGQRTDTAEALNLHALAALQRIGLNLLRIGIEILPHTARCRRTDRHSHGKQDSYPPRK